MHSGDALGQALALTRAGVWQHIQILKTMGLPIASYHRKGYQLSQPIERLSKESILSHVNPSHQLEGLDLFATLPSTNQYLIERAQPNIHCRACIAEHQSSGKGRLRRPWVSPFGGSVALSILRRFFFDPSCLMGLSLAVAVAVVRALEHYGLDTHPIHLKWPNDVYLHDKKLGGILLELHGALNSESCVVLGVGLNIRLDQDVSIDQPYTDLQSIHSDQPIEHNRLTGLILDAILQALSQFETYGFSCFMDEWHAHDYLYQRAISLQYNQKIIEGVSQGITERGELIIKENDGTLHHLLSGEAKLVKPTVSEKNTSSS